MSLSIIIPTINRPTLQRAIDSVKHQTVPTKLVVIPDPKRHGAARTRNKGVRAAQTDWVGFLDDDDELDKHYHQWLMPYMDNDLVIFKMKNQPNGGIPYTLSVEELVYNQVGISFALRRELALTRRFQFHTMIGEDYNLIINVRNAGYKIKILDKIAYYIHGKHGTD